ncbi:MAG: DUF3662 and FHA domain-containing protein [Micrococcales bacterium]|nr:DUF3662 and FHA domain-containing protein [Micrococcales bacterium]
MGLLESFENAVDRAVNTAFSKVFPSELKPVQLVSALRREMDNQAAALDKNRTVAPNEFTIELSTPDFDRLEQWGAETLADEFATNVTEHAASQRYAFVGPVTVRFSEDPKMDTGSFSVTSASVRGAVAPVTSNAPSAKHPLIDIDGQRYLLTGPVTVIGRGSESDIIVDDAGVSRRHLEIKVTPNGVVASDMGSTNGMYVEGNKVPAATLLDGNTITIGRTRILFWTGGESDQDG